MHKNKEIIEDLIWETFFEIVMSEKEELEQEIIEDLIWETFVEEVLSEKEELEQESIEELSTALPEARLVSQDDGSSRAQI